MRPGRGRAARGALGRSTLAALIAGGATACIEVPPPAASGAVRVKQLQPSEGVALDSTCVTTGVERCFDALDNNCNGVIDEGCGLHTGVLQFAIAWQQANADVDLEVSGPDGDLARFDEPNEAGLIKDRDCPGSDDQCYGQNVENVYLAEGDPKPGRYHLVVRLEDPQQAALPIRVRLSARLGQRHFTSLVELHEQGEQHEIDLVL